jgi:hypothetical protein
MKDILIQLKKILRINILKIHVIFLYVLLIPLKNHVEISTLSNLDFSLTKSDRDFVFLSVLKLEIKKRA